METDDESEAGAQSEIQVLTTKEPKNSEDPEDIGETPTSVQRRCTDWFWILPFLLALAGAGWITWYASQHNNRANLVTPFDFTGYKCGQVFRADRPYLYFCRQANRTHANAQHQLNMEYPICVSECPSSSKSSKSSLAYRMDLPALRLFCWGGQRHSSAPEGRPELFQLAPGGGLSILSSGWCDLSP